MILSHGANSISRNTLIDFLYLTYYNNFNTSTGVDVPIVGNEVTYPNDTGVYSINTITYGNIVYPALKYSPDAEAAKRADIISTSGMTSSTISIELICALYRSDYDTESDIGLYGCIFGLFSAENNIKIRIDNDSQSIITHNGLTLYSGNAYQLPDIYSYTELTMHIAIVCTNLTQIKIYVDGVLYIEFTRTVIPSHIKLVNYIYRSIAYSKFTQLAVRNGDFSINDGANYPVPTQPYVLIS